MACVFVETDEINGESHPIALGNETIIGRDKINGVFIDDPRASREHAKIIREADGSYYLVDLGSRNGTIVNGERVFRRKLKEKDRIAIGRAVLIFSEISLPPDKQEQIFKEPANPLSVQLPEPVDINTITDKSGVNAKQIPSITYTSSDIGQPIRSAPAEGEARLTGRQDKPAKASQVKEKVTTKSESVWLKIFIFVALLIFFATVLLWAKWAGEKLIAYMIKSRQAVAKTDASSPR